MIRQLKIVVGGRVQGVGFRAFSQNEARRLGVLGFVKNLPDGRVEIVAQADDKNLQDFIAGCHKGPLSSRVDSVEVSELESQEIWLQSFDIIR